MPVVVRLCDYHHSGKAEHSGEQSSCAVIGFPVDRIVRWPEQRWPVVVVLPIPFPPFFKVIEHRV